jgi:hypothetical protein
MKKIIVGFSRSKKKFPIASWAIMAYQCTKFSHTYIRLLTKGKFPSDKILHASEGLVQNMSGTMFDLKHQVIDEFEISIPDILVLDKTTNDKVPMYKALVNIMHETSGDNYSLLQNFGILYVDFMRRIFKKRVKNPFTKGWNCSEFVAFILKNVYPKQFNKLDINTVTPKEVYDILNRLDKDERYEIQKNKK